MKIVFTLTLVIALQASASVYSQHAKISLNYEQARLGDVLSQIENDTEFVLFYRHGTFDQDIKVNIHADGKNIHEVLDEMFRGTGIEWAVKDRLIILGTKDAVDVATLQSITITGQVTDTDGFPLPGVSVMVKGTTRGTATDANGMYSLQITDDNTVLVFAYIGFTTQELTVGSRRNINVTLADDTRVLDEVVVIGYGTMKKSDLTGSVSSITEKHFKDQPITRLDQALNGRIPGLMLVTNSGSPDQSITIRIRGANSIYGGNDPLFIVDGIPNKALFDTLDPNDIQSIEVLKDASSTAIYGSRGANGVILVTTRRGAEGKARVLFETQHSWSVLGKDLDMMTAYEFAQSINERDKRETFSQQQLADFQAGKAGTNWRDLIFRTAYSQNHKLNISGGNDKLGYLVSANYMDTQGILILSENKRINVRSNITAKATDWLKLDLDMNAFRRYYSKNGSRGNWYSPINDSYCWAPVMELKDANGNWSKDTYASITRNPYGDWTQSLDDNNASYVNVNLKLTFELPVKGLTFNVQGATDYSAVDNYYFLPTTGNLHSQSNGNNTKQNWFNWYSINQLNYVNTWGDHRVNAMAVAEFQNSEYTSLYGSSSNFSNEALTYWNLAMGEGLSISNGTSTESMASFIARAFYSFKDRYMLTATFRRDGTSKFQENKWGNFPSVGLSWILSEENAVKNMNVFDVLKLRATWGIAGNQAIGAYSTLGLLDSPWYAYGENTNYRIGYALGNPPTPGLTWEKTKQIDVGLDFGFFNNRLFGSIDAYQKNTYDLLLAKPIPYYMGGGSTWVNQGKVNNRGIDLSLTGVIIKNRDMQWESMLNFAYTKNEVIDLGGNELLNFGRLNQSLELDPCVLMVGHPMGSLYGFTWLGLWQTSEAAEAAKYGKQPGDNKWKTDSEINKPGAVDAGVIGKAFPDVTMGWNNTFTWKNWDVNVFFQGAFGADRLNFGRWYMNTPASDQWWMTAREGWFDRWTPENQNTIFANPLSGTVDNHVASNQFLEKANYVRLKNISFSYTFPKSMTKVGDIKLSLSGQNIFTFTKYKGLDPEGTMNSWHNVGHNADLSAGVDGISYPLPRTFSLGLRVMF